MNKEQLIEVIKCASKFMAKQDVRHCLNGICIEFELGNRTIVTATDGHRLFTAAIDGAHSVTTVGEYVISAVDVAKIVKLYDWKKDESKELDFELVTTDHDYLQINDGKISYNMQPVNGKYPNWRLAIPAFGGEDAKSNTHIEFGMNLE